MTSRPPAVLFQQPTLQDVTPPNRPIRSTTYET
jgi:hypothetical protein